MAISAQELIENIDAFISFEGKNAAIVGAGGGQLIGYGKSAKKVIAIDNNAEAIRQLMKAISEKGNSSKYEVVLSDFYAYNSKVDLIVFEFSLHEINDMRNAISHAKSIAKEVYVIDHENKGEWIGIVQEVEKIKHEDEILVESKYQNKKTYETLQRFADYEELERKVYIQGLGAISAIRKYAGKKNIEISMCYKIVKV